MEDMTTSLSHIVDHFEEHYKGAEELELNYFRSRAGLKEAVSEAAMARMNGQKFSHQWRIPLSVLEESRRRLLDNLGPLRTAESFDDLHDTVEAIIGGIAGVGELLLYDTALRIGAYLGLAPSSIYLHAGTREGARALGLEWRKRTLPMSTLPKALQRLSAGEAESLLCMYKPELKSTSTNLNPHEGYPLQPLGTATTTQGCR